MSDERDEVTVRLPLDVAAHLEALRQHGRLGAILDVPAVTCATLAANPSSPWLAAHERALKRRRVTACGTVIAPGPISVGPDEEPEGDPVE